MLRSFSGVPFLKQQFERDCKGNLYATTIHGINSAVIKLSKLQVACPVYRGSTRAVLPPQFWEKDGYGLSGGVEFGFSAQTAFVQGYNFGLWKGVLESCVNPETTRVEVVKPQAWKLALGLSGKKTSKDDSIEMAKMVFPESEDMLQRKKDHGRAESLLIVGLYQLMFVC